MNSRISKLFFSVILLFLFGLSVPLFAIESVKLSFKAQPPKTRWIYSSEAKDIKPAFKALANLKRSQILKDYKSCHAQSKPLYTKYSSIRPWILALQFDCELNLKGESSISRLKELNATLRSQNTWLLFGPYKDILKDVYVKSYFAIADWEMKKKPQVASQTIGALIDLQEWMTKEQKARVFQLAGELAFMKQNLSISKIYILKSLSFVEDANLRKKLSSVDAALSPSEETQPQVGTPTAQPEVILGGEEQKIADRISEALKSGDLFSAAKDGITLIKDYPGSIRTDWASDRIMESYLSIASKDESRYLILKNDFVQLMKKADSGRLLDWASGAFRNGYYQDASVLAEEAQKKSEVPPLELLSLLAESYLQNHDMKSSAKIYKEISDKFSGTKEAVRAYLYLGMIHYNQNDFTKAQFFLEKVLAQTQFLDYELTARYWLWRTLQNTDKERANSEAQFLAQNFPFSYYGLRAISELNQGEINFSSLDKKLTGEQEIWLSPKEKESWERLQTLLSAGWYDEANMELDEIPAPSSPQGMALWARYYSAAFNNVKAIRLLNQAWDSDPNLRILPLLDIAYPRDFQSTVTQQAQVRGLDPILVMSLIRQESSFHVRAKSSSNALGLMQMIPPTANEVATLLKIKNFNLDMVFDPNTNISMGTYYLSKVLKQFEGNIPLALAGYNAGPAKVKRWMKSYRLSPEVSSGPKYEIWLDLLPWSETRFYVKAILRNYLIYQLIDSKKISVNEPIWPVSKD